MTQSGNAKLSVRTASIDARVLAHDTGFFGSPAGMIVGHQDQSPAQLWDECSYADDDQCIWQCRHRHDHPSAKLSFSNVDSGDIGATGITWSNSAPTVYGIHRTAGAWTAPDFQQLRLGWQTGIVLDGGTAYGKSYVDVQGDGLRVAGAVRFLTNSNPLHFTSGWSNFPSGGTNIAEISNDTVAYKTLMLIGNRSNDAAVRRVSVWDRLEVNGTLMVSGGLTVLEQEAWKEIPLTPGWGSFGVGYGPGEDFKDSHGVVHLRGLIKVINLAAYTASLSVGNGHFSSYQADTVPNIGRFSQHLEGNNNGLCRVDITNDGKLWGMTGSPGEWFSLDSISFRAE